MLTTLPDSFGGRCDSSTDVEEEEVDASVLDDELLVALTWLEDADELLLLLDELPLLLDELDDEDGGCSATRTAGADATAYAAGTADEDVVVVLVTLTTPDEDGNFDGWATEGEGEGAAALMAQLRAFETSRENAAVSAPCGRTNSAILGVNANTGIFELMALLTSLTDDCMTCSCTTD